MFKEICKQRLIFINIIINKRDVYMSLLTKTLDALASVCVALLFTKYFIHYANDMFDWHLRWYFLENIPHLALILFILTFIFAVPSEMIKDKEKKVSSIVLILLYVLSHN